MERVTQPTVVSFPRPKPDQTTEAADVDARLNGIDAIERLIDIHGVKWVAAIVRSFAALRGEEI